MPMLQRHGRFLAGFAIGLGVGAAVAALPSEPAYALLAGVDAFFVVYLALTARIIGGKDAATLRRHAAEEDEGLALILMLAGISVLASVTAIFLVLNADASTFAARGLALISLPLGWATIHVLAGFRYAHLHYRGAEKGMDFPGKHEPDAWDFLYASFTIGMTAQVSDVEVLTPTMRRAVLVHGVASFFYNTCILALAVNAAVTAGQ